MTMIDKLKMLNKMLTSAEAVSLLGHLIKQEINVSTFGSLCTEGKHIEPYIHHKELTNGKRIKVSELRFSDGEYRLKKVFVELFRNKRELQQNKKVLILRLMLEENLDVEALPEFVEIGEGKVRSVRLYDYRLFTPEDMPREGWVDFDISFRREDIEALAAKANRLGMGNIDPQTENLTISDEEPDTRTWRVSLHKDNGTIKNPKSWIADYLVPWLLEQQAKNAPFPQAKDFLTYMYSKNPKPSGYKFPDNPDGPYKTFDVPVDKYSEKYNVIGAEKINRRIKEYAKNVV